MAQLSAAEEAHAQTLAALESDRAAAIESAAAAAAAETAARLQAEHEGAMVAEKEAAGGRLGALSTDVSALSAVLSHDTAYKRVSHQTHQLTAAVLTVREALHGKASSAALALKTLPGLASRLGDDLLVEAFKPLTGSGAAHYAKVPTVAQLTARFDDVAAAGRTAALVPEAAPGLWGHALAGITSLVTLRAAETGHTEASTSLATAEAALARGDLRHAVAAVKCLEGPSAWAASGWLRAAEERLLLEQMLTVATAEATISTAALAPH